MNEDKCVKCGKVFQEEEGRFNFPAGARCLMCGKSINRLLTQAEGLLDKYALKTGYRPRIRY